MHSNINSSEPNVPEAASAFRVFTYQSDPRMFIWLAKIQRATCDDILDPFWIFLHRISPVFDFFHLISEWNQSGTIFHHFGYNQLQYSSAPWRWGVGTALLEGRIKACIWTDFNNRWNFENPCLRELIARMCTPSQHNGMHTWSVLLLSLNLVSFRPPPAKNLGGFNPFSSVIKDVASHEFIFRLQKQRQKITKEKGIWRCRWVQRP